MTIETIHHTRNIYNWETFINYHTLLIMDGINGDNLLKMKYRIVVKDEKTNIPFITLYTKNLNWDGVKTFIVIFEKSQNSHLIEITEQDFIDIKLDANTIILDNFSKLNALLGSTITLFFEGGQNDFVVDSDDIIITDSDKLTKFTLQFYTGFVHCYVHDIVFGQANSYIIPFVGNQEDFLEQYVF